MNDPLPIPPYGYQLLTKTEQLKKRCVSEGGCGYGDWQASLLPRGLRWNERAACWEKGPFHFLWYFDTYAVPARGADLKDL